MARCSHDRPAMTRAWHPLGRKDRWQGIVSLLSAILIVAGAFAALHCVDDHGMDPDLCAMLMGAVTIVVLAGLLVSGRLAADIAPTLTPFALAPLALPPEISRS